MLIKNSSITIINDTKSYVIDFKFLGVPIKMDDDNWHFVVGSWKQSGETLVTVDSLKIFGGHSVTGIIPKQ